MIMDVIILFITIFFSFVACFDFMAITSWRVVLANFTNPNNNSHELYRSYCKQAENYFYSW